MSQYLDISKLRNGEDIVAMTVVNDSNGTVEMTLPCNIALQPSMVGKGTVIKLSPCLFHLQKIIELFNFILD